MGEDVAPTMSVEDAEDFTVGLGQVFAGGWRLIALAQRQGVPAALGMTTENWVRDRLGGYVKLSIEDRREAVKELHGEGLSYREIGAVVGVTPMTVSRDARATFVTEAAEKPENGAETHATAVANVTPLPTIAAEDAERMRTAVGEVIERALADPPLSHRMHLAEMQASSDCWCVENTRTELTKLLAVPSERLIESWFVGRRRTDLVETLTWMAETLTAYVAAFKAAPSTRLRVVAPPDEGAAGA